MNKPSNYCHVTTEEFSGVLYTLNASYRVMSEVLPTDWSPRSTILVRFRGEDVKSAVVGVPELAIILQRGWLRRLGC